MARVGSSISIHAPMKGATIHATLLRHLHIISIHAPMKGATRVTVLGLLVAHISIHAPMKGATCMAASTESGMGFQSTLP